MAAARISPEQERIVRFIAGGIAVYTVAAGALGAAVGLEFMGGALVGGTLAYVNFIWFASIVRGLLAEQSTPRGLALKTGAKTLVTYGAVGALIWFGLVDAIGFLVGLSGLFAATVAAMVKFRRLGAEAESESSGAAEGGAGNQIREE